MASKCANCCESESAHPVAIFTSEKYPSDKFLIPEVTEPLPVINMFGFPFYRMKICTKFQEFVQLTIFD